MASLSSQRRAKRGTLFVVLRLVTALALALMALPALNASAYADEASTDPVVSTETPETDPALPDPGDTTDPVPSAPEAEEPVVEEPEAPPAAEEPAPDTSEPAKTPAKTLTRLSTDGVEALAVVDVCDQPWTKIEFLQFESYKLADDYPGSPYIWANGNMNDVKANLVEGEFVWQRVLMEGLAAGPQKLVLTYDTMSGGKHAYDFLDHFTLTVGTDLVMTHVTDPSDSNVEIATITWNMPAAGNTTLQFGAHIASELDWGAGTGAGSINGSPYHVSLKLLNCDTTGQKDNQIMASAVDAGDITVTKDAVPNSLDDFFFTISPGGAASTNFPLDDDAGVVGATTTYSNTTTFSAGPGDYTITENGANTGGWNLTDISCVSLPIGESKADTTGAGIITETATSVTVRILDDVETACTFTNSRASTVEVDKVWNINGVIYNHGSQPAIVGATAQLKLDTVDKAWNTTHGGYLQGAVVSIDESAAVSNDLCSITGKLLTTANGQAVTAENGGLPYDATLDGGANTYTITNTVACRSPLTLVKVVDNGPALASAWTLSATPTDGGAVFASGASGVTHDVTAGKTYTLGENAADVLYVQDGTWTCTNNVAVTAGQIVAPLGEATTCTVHNATAKLTLIKEVINDDGGTSVPASFTLKAIPSGGPAGLDDVSVVGSTAGVDSWVRPDVTYDLSEEGPAGYASTLQCKSGVDGTYATATSVNLDAEEHVYCRWVNDDKASKLTLEKVVDTNDSGTDVTAKDFTLTATLQSDPGTVLSGNGEDGFIDRGVSAGVWALSETGPSGFDEGTWDCGPTHPVDTVDGKHLVTIGLDDDVSCQIVNTAQKPTLTLVKIVSGNDATGGTALPSAWTLTADGPEDLVGTSGVTKAVLVGSYALSESGGPDGYEASAWNCGDSAVVDGSVALALGDDVTCTITNVAQPAHLTLVKNVDNGDTGATTSASAWTLTADGPTPVSGLSGSDGVEDQPVKAGTYDLSESGPGGYTASAWDCGDQAVVAGSVTLALGDDVTCEITNTAIKPKLTLVKNVVNTGTDGTALPTDWTLFGVNGEVDSVSGAGGATKSVKIGSYTLSEVAAAIGRTEGYSASAWTCGDHAVVLGKVSLALGDDVTCQITNTATPGTWTVAKSSDPESGSTVLPGDTITYTVTAMKTGGVDSTDVDVFDDLSQVLDNATLVPGSIVASTGTASVDPETQEMTWSIPLLHGTETVTYQVVVNEGAYGVTLKNLVTSPGSDPCPAEDPDCTTTEHFTPSWSLAKASEPVSGSTVVPGESVTYTLTATNTSLAMLEGASAEDDLSDVLDNATLTEPLAAGLSLSGTTLTWAVPTLAPGDVATVTYTVTVSADQWDQTLRNVVTPTNLGGECDEAGDCTTEHFTPAWELTKVSDPVSGSEVDPGDSITYTLRAVNTSDAVVEGATAEDDLSEVLNNATLDETSLPDELTLSGTTLTWAIPTLAPGGEASVSYTVTVDTDAFNVILENVVVPVGAGGVCVEADDCTTTHDTPEILGEEVVKPRPRPPVVLGGELPDTGAPRSGTLIGLLGSLTVGLGALLMSADRRRRQQLHR